MKDCNSYISRPHERSGMSQDEERAKRYAEVIEEVLGILIEEGNGTTSKEIHYAADLLFWARDGGPRPQES